MFYKNKNHETEQILQKSKTKICCLTSFEINCERFKPTKPINRKLKTILSLSHSEGLNQLLSVVCRNIGVKLIIHNKYKTPIWDIENKINEADLVVSLGRGAYEAMACGRNVLILDNRGYVKGGAIGDGSASPLTLPYFMKNNCSGRFTNKSFEYKDLVVELFSIYEPISIKTWKDLK